MKQKRVYLETFILFAITLLLVTVGSFSLQVQLLNKVFPSKNWAPRSSIIRIVLFIYSDIVFLAACGSFILIRRQSSTLSYKFVGWIQSILSEIQATWEWFCSRVDSKDAILWLALVIAIGTAIRGYFLAQPMRSDEASTFLYFVNKDILDLFRYPLPNNHVLHTLLVKTSVEFFGNGEVAIRLPAFFAGLLVIPLTFSFSRLLTRSKQSGFLASGLVSIFPYLVLYDTMARGYSLLVLFSIFLAVLMLRLIEEPSTAQIYLISLVTALGLFDIPTFLFPAAGLSLWVFGMLLYRGYQPLWIISRLLVPFVLTTMGLTAFFYTPVIIATNGVLPLIANKYVKSLSWSAFLAQLPGHVSTIVHDFTRHIPAIFIIIFLSLLVVSFYLIVRRKHENMLMLLPALLIGGLLVLFAKRAIPYVRTWIYLIPFVFIIIDVAWTTLQSLNSKFARYALILFFSYSAIILLNKNVISTYKDTGHFPEAPVLVELLSHEMFPESTIVMRNPVYAPMEYYMWKFNVPRDKNNPDKITRVFYVVKPSRYSLNEMTDLETREIIAFGDAALYVAEWRSQ